MIDLVTLGREIARIDFRLRGNPLVRNAEGSPYQLRCTLLPGLLRVELNVSVIDVETGTLSNIVRCVTFHDHQLAPKDLAAFALSIVHRLWSELWQHEFQEWAYRDGKRLHDPHPFQKVRGS